MKKDTSYRELILLSALHMADEVLLGRKLILFLAEKVSTKRVINPERISSKCHLFWSNPKNRVCKRDEKLILENLTNALGIVLSNHHFYRKRKAEMMKSKMRGWKISEGHKRNQNKK